MHVTFKIINNIVNGYDLLHQSCLTLEAVVGRDSALEALDDIPNLIDFRNALTRWQTQEASHAAFRHACKFVVGLESCIVFALCVVPGGVTEPLLLSNLQADDIVGLGGVLDGNTASAV